MAYSIEITSNATETLNRIRDRRIRRLLAARTDNLALDPEKQGSPLGGLMTDYRSCRAVGQRYRIVYRIDNDKTVAIVGVIGIRKAGGPDDVYAKTEKLARLRLL